MAAELLTLAMVLALADRCAPDVDRNLIAGIARHESGFNPQAIHVNDNGTIDRGLMQINSKNLGMLGLTAEQAFEPCHSIAAAAKLFKYISVYNTGSTTRGLAPCGPGAPPGCGYTTSTLASIRQVKAESAGVQVTEMDAPKPPPESVCNAPSWDVWNRQSCFVPTQPPVDQGDHHHD